MAWAKYFNGHIEIMQSLATFSSLDTHLRKNLTAVFFRATSVFNQKAARSAAF